jgi:uncharacterized repeat protein (TIGR01451 family)
MIHRLPRPLYALLPVILGLALCFTLLNLTAQAQPSDPPILAEHCGDVGPLPYPFPSDWCGCVWGAAYVNGSPQAGVTITLSQGVFSATFVTTDTYWNQPYYALDGHWIGAVRGDLMTMTATFEGQTITRTYRAFPNPATMEQQMNLVFPTGAGDPPNATLSRATFNVGDLELSGEGTDNDEDGQAILGYQWRSDVDGVIGTEQTAVLPLTDLTPTAHIISLRVQDDEGEWSSPVTLTLPLHLLHPLAAWPPLNSHVVPPAASIVITYNQAVDPATVNAQTLPVHALQTGQLTGTYQVNGDSVHITPIAPLHPGELVQYTLTTGPASVSGHNANRSFVRQFRGAVHIGTGFFSALPISTTHIRDIALGDIDGDGDLDLVIAGGPGQPNEIWFNDGQGGLTRSDQTLSTSAKGVALGDLDGDGDLDLFIVYEGAGAGRPNEVWFNDGSGYFEDSGQALGEGDSIGVALGDLDGDGDLDAFVANWILQPNRVWLNDGDGYFGDSGQTLGNGRSVAVDLGDLDGDGDLDAVVGNWNQDLNTIWMNDGSGAFTLGQRVGYAASTNTKDLALGDLDGDGDLDLFIANQWGQANQVWLNDGKGHFSDSGQRLGQSSSEGVALGDLDGDGDLDAFVANEGKGTAAADKVWFNDGQGTFTPGLQKLGSGNSQAIAPLGDLDGDGDLDAVVGDEDAPSKVWFNLDTRFAIRKYAPTTALPGTPFTYTLCVTNAGNAPVNHLVITDALPAGAHYVRGGTLGADGVVSWTVDTLAPKQVLAVNLVVTATQTLTNAAYGVSASDAVSATGPAVVVHIGTLPHVQSMTFSPGQPALDQPVTFTTQITSPVPFTATWALEDRVVAGQTITHVFHQPGRHPFTLRVGNRYGLVTHTGAISVTAPASTWLVLLYLNGDNNLDRWLHGALNALETQAATDAVRVITLSDGQYAGDTRMHDVRANQSFPLQPYTAWYSDEVNMGTPETLSGFVNWAIRHYPAEHVYLSIANHGAGLQGISWDTNSEDDYLDPDELAAFVQALDGTLDVLHLDACLMSMGELAYLFRDTADYMVASQNLAWGIFAYAQYIEGLAEQNPQALAVHIADTYSAALPANRPYTISALDLGQMTQLTQEVYTLTRALTTTGDYRDTLTGVLSQVQRFDSQDYTEINLDDEYIDLYHFAQLTQEQVNHPDVDAAAQAVMDRLASGQPGSVVLQEHHHSGEWDLDDAHGLSLYYPSNAASHPYEAYYNDPYNFPDDSGWRQLIETYVGPPPLPVPPGEAEPAPTLIVEQHVVYLPLVVRGE